MNRVELVGRLTRDAEIRYVGDKRWPIVSLNLAVDDAEGRWNPESKKTELGSGFYRVESAGPGAAAMQPTLTKGDRLYVLGSLNQFSYSPRDGGEKQSKTQIKAQVIINLSSGERPTDPAMTAPDEPLTDSSWDEEPF